MQSSNRENSKRIAKNTLLLYVRMIFTMFVALFTSRIVLETLGVEDYGIYNVVGGVVVMFSLFTSSLSAAISRFLTFELGINNKIRLNLIFSSSINVLLLFSLALLILIEIVGVWFLNSKLNIPVERMNAANWVMQCSIIVFIINLISVPYNAAIISHEKMSAFAYISVLEAIMKLGVAYLLYISLFDKLITYALLLIIVSLIIRMVYGIYCNKHFEECKYRRVLDKSLRIVYFLSVCSIVVTTLYMFIPSVFVYFPTISNYADVTFYNLYISVVFASVDVIRNTGIFREPGVFMIYLTFALMLELFFFKKRDIRNIIVFVIALLLTKSTAGYIITFLLLGFKYLFYSKLKYLPFFFVIILCFVIFLFPHIEEEVFSKLDEDNYNYLSTLSRISSVVLPIQMWLDNPFYGIGLGHFSSLYSIYAMKEFGMDFRSDSSSTNTILNTITIYGWWIGVMVVYGMYKTTYCFVNQKNILLLLIFLLLFSNEEMRNSLFYNLLVAYGFASKNDNRILKNELCFLR